MSIPNAKKERIAHTVIKVLNTRFNSFPNEDDVNRNAPFHVAFVRAFQSKLEGRVKNIPDFINLSSWMHGLNTTLGQTFFENVAHILCDGQKREFKSNEIYKNQVIAISEIMTNLKNGVKHPSLYEEECALRLYEYGEKEMAPNFTADCFYETNKKVVAIELKSVRPNSGEMRGEKQKILTGKAVLEDKYPGKEVNYIFGFPFDPTASEDVGYNKERFLKYLVEAEKFIAHEDFLIADELWSFLADSKNAMQEILDIINAIATPEFMEKFEKIQAKETSSKEKREIFNDWFLYTEIEILDKVVETTKNSRIYNQTIFKTDGSYNDNRLKLLKDIE